MDRPMLNSLIVTAPEDVDFRLRQLGLDRDSIVDVVQQGYFAYISSTANHPPMYAGFVAWAEMVKGLREYLLPKHWSRCDENNYSRVIDPLGTMAIAVSTGDIGTGQSHLNPATKAPKGPSTADAVSVNFDLFNPDPEPGENEVLLTWILLVSRSATEVLCELSLPLMMGKDGRVDLWKERIIVGKIPMDLEPVAMAPAAPTPDIEVGVKRRT